MTKNKYYGIAVAIVLAGYILLYGILVATSAVPFPLNWLFYFLYSVSWIFMSRFYNKKRNQQLDYMWELADSLKLTAADLKQYSRLGLYDLEATQKAQRTFIPSQAEVAKIIQQLEALK